MNESIILLSVLQWTCQYHQYLLPARILHSVHDTIKPFIASAVANKLLPYEPMAFRQLNVSIWELVIKYHKIYSNILHRIRTI